MKAYIIKIELLDSDPLIWRRVIMPADATFNRLHDVIQAVTNFQSGYPHDGYHLFRFDLPEDNLAVTNDEEAYLERQHYKKNKALYAKRLKKASPAHLKFEQFHQDQLKIEIRKPTGLKIDKYLEAHKEIHYLYDFGSDWQFTITLENTVDDYYFGYPTLLDGAETAPPEDVGGIDGFYEFLAIYRDETHPEHEEMKQWAQSQWFREYDPDRTNSILKSLHYKKTEWDKINHDNHRIIKDKYRKE